VAILAVGEDDAGDEGAERGGEPDELHHERDADDEQQGGRGEELALTGTRDAAEDRVDEMPTGKHHERDRENDEGGLLPTGQRGDRGGGAGGGGGLFRREQRKQREDRDDGDVLEEEDGEGALARGGFKLAAFLQRLQHDRRGGHGEDKPGGKRQACAETKGEAEAGDGGGGAEDLQAAEAEQLAAHFPEARGLELEADEKEHHHDAEFGEVHHVAGVFADEAEDMRADEDAREEVAEDRAEAEAFGERHGDDSRDEIDEGVKEDGVHAGEAGGRRCPAGGGAAACSPQTRRRVERVAGGRGGNLRAASADSNLLSR